MGMESLGHRDLPYKRISRVDKQPVYTTKLVRYVLFNSIRCNKITTNI